MTIIKQKSFNLTLVFALLLSLVLPTISLAANEGVGTDESRGSLTIHKFKQEKGADDGLQVGPEAGDQVPEGALPVAGVTYEVTQTHSFDGANWRELAGSSFEMITEEDGKISRGNLDLGRYTIKEIDGPKDVILNTEEFSVDIPMTYNDGKDVSYDVNIYPKNEIIRGDAELIKVNEAGGVLEGVKFGLYKENNELIEELTTNIEGKIGFDGLAAGKYYFQELETTGDYALNNSKINFEVKKDQDGQDGKTVVEWTNVTGFVEQDDAGDVKVTNYKNPDIQKEVTGDSFDRGETFQYILKVKTPQDIAKYTDLVVTDELDSRLTATGEWSVSGVNKEAITYSAGPPLTWTFNNPETLPADSEITITFDAKIKDNAVLDESIINVGKIDFATSQGGVGSKETAGVPINIKEGSVLIEKVDKSDESLKLPGAEFKLTTDENGNNVVDATDRTIQVNDEAFSGNLENLATDANGLIKITGLNTGTYFLHETKAPIADDGKAYRLLTKPIEVDVADSIEENRVVVENAKSGWVLPTTGGIGTLLFTLIGLALMAIALIAYMRHRKTAEK